MKLTIKQKLKLLRILRKRYKVEQSDLVDEYVNFLINYAEENLDKVQIERTNSTLSIQRQYIYINELYGSMSGAVYYRPSIKTIIRLIKFDEKIKMHLEKYFHDEELENLEKTLRLIQSKWQ